MVVASTNSTGTNAFTVEEKLTNNEQSHCGSSSSSNVTYTKQEENEAIAREFVRQYYTILARKPDMFHRFYANSSSLIIDGAIFYGVHSIKSKIKSLDIHDCHARIYQIDVTRTGEHGFCVQIFGEISLNNKIPRQFVQNVLLASSKDEDKKLFVEYDNFRHVELVWKQKSTIFGNVEHQETVNNSAESSSKSNKRLSVENEEPKAAEEISKGKYNAVAASSNMDAKAAPFIPSSQYHCSDPETSVERHQTILISDSKNSGDNIHYMPDISAFQEQAVPLTADSCNTDEQIKHQYGQQILPTMSYAGVAAALRASNNNITSIPSSTYVPVTLPSQLIVGVHPSVPGLPTQFSAQTSNQMPQVAYALTMTEYGPAGEPMTGLKAMELHRDMNVMPLVAANPLITNAVPNSGGVGPGAAMLLPQQDYFHQKYNAYNQSSSVYAQGPSIIDKNSELQIYVNNFPMSFNKKAFENYFSRFGRVTDVFINSKNDISFAFVTFDNASSVRDAVNCQHHNVEGTNIKLVVEKKRTMAQRNRLFRGAFDGPYNKASNANANRSSNFIKQQSLSNQIRYDMHPQSNL